MTAEPSPSPGAITIALRYRLPHAPHWPRAAHAPSAQRRRDAASAALVERLSRQTTLVLWGDEPEALIMAVSQALHAIDPEAPARALVVSCQAQDLMGLLRQLLQIVQDTLRGQPLPWASMRAALDEHLAALLDLIAAHALRVILLDVEALAEDGAARLARQSARYLRAGSLIVISQGDASGWASTLAMRWPKTTPATRQARAGSALESPRDDARISQALRRRAQALRACQAIDPEGWGVEALRESLDQLHAAGWLRRVAGELRWTAQAPQADAAATQELTRWLEQQQTPACALAALHLSWSSLDEGQRAALAWPWLERWLARGHSATLWRLLEPLEPTQDALRALRDEVALAWLSPAQLGALHAPAGAAHARSPAVATRWARVLMERHEHERALVWCQSALEREPSALLRVLQIHAWMALGAMEQVAAHLGQPPPSAASASERRWRDATLALSLVWAQRPELASQALERAAKALGPRHQAARPDEQTEHAWLEAAARINLARAAHLLGQLSQASALLDQVQPQLDALALPEYRPAALMYLRALLAVEQLDMAELAQRLETFGPLREGHTTLGVHLQSLWAHLHEWRGEDAALARTLRDMEQTCAAIHATDLGHVARQLDAKRRMRRLGAAHGALAPAAPGTPAPSALVQRRLDALERERGWRLSMPEALPERAPDDASAAQRALLRALRGQPGPARAMVLEAHALACAGQRRREAHQLALLEAELALSEGDLPGAASALERAAAQEPGGQLTQAHARTLAQALELLERPTSLEQLCSYVGTPGLLSRLVEPLLGGDWPEDALERAMSAQLAARRSWRALGALPQRPQPGQARWVLDLGGARLGWVESLAQTSPTPDEDHAPRAKPPQMTWRALTGKPLALVVALASASAQGLTKEQLLASLWGIKDYHPLRHDNRLRMTAHKARHALAQAARLEATEDGYQLIAREQAPLVLVGPRPRNQEKSSSP